MEFNYKLLYNRYVFEEDANDIYSIIFAIKYKPFILLKKLYYEQYLRRWFQLRNTK